MTVTKSLSDMTLAELAAEEAELDRQIKAGRREALALSRPAKLAEKNKETEPSQPGRSACKRRHQPSGQPWQTQGGSRPQQTELRVSRVHAKTVPCPHCGAAAHESCKRRNGKPRIAVHRDRQVAYLSGNQLRPERAPVEPAPPRRPATEADAAKALARWAEKDGKCGI